MSVRRFRWLPPSLGRQRQTVVLVVAMLRQHRLRTALAALGVFLGALLLTSILHVLDGVTLKVKQDAERLGSHTMTIIPGRVHFSRVDTPGVRGAEGGGRSPGDALGVISGVTGGASAGAKPGTTSSPGKGRARTAATLTLADVTAVVHGFPQVLQAAPFITATGRISPFPVGDGGLSPLQGAYALGRVDSGSACGTTSLPAPRTVQPDDRNKPDTVGQSEHRGLPPTVGQGNASEGSRRTASGSTCRIYATTLEYLAVRHARLQSGRFINAADDAARQLVCVLGHDLAARLFGDVRQAVGGHVRLMDAALRVVGVMERRGMDPFGTQLDEMVFLPLNTYAHRLTEQDYLSGADFTIAGRDDIETLRDGVTVLLRRAHHLPEAAPDDFSISFGDHVDTFVGNALRLVRALGFVGATISFAVGTLGILSIMTLLVRSRRVEIGIRRAVGATRRDIMAQFVCEAAVMALAGGGLGVVAGVVPVVLLVSFEVVPPCYDAGVVAWVFVLSAGCGIGAGAYPAWRAARTGVLQALRED